MTLTLDLTHFLSNWIWNEKIQTFCLLLVLRLCVVCCAVLLCCVVLLWFFFIWSVCQLLHLHSTSRPHAAFCRLPILLIRGRAVPFRRAGAQRINRRQVTQVVQIACMRKVQVSGAPQLTFCCPRAPIIAIATPTTTRRTNNCHRHTPSIAKRKTSECGFCGAYRITDILYIYSFGFWRTSSSVRFGNFRHLGPHPILLNVKENPLFWNRTKIAQFDKTAVCEEHSTCCCDLSPLGIQSEVVITDNHHTICAWNISLLHIGQLFNPLAIYLGAT